MKIKKLKANKRNPRKITESRQIALKRSLEKFGDLGGIIFNKRTGQLVGGHQRSKVIPQDSSTVIEKKFDAPTQAGTVAEGYIEFSGERFKYREVDWSEEIEVEAMLAANNQGGQNDEGLLKIVLADFPKLDLELAGLPELKPLASLPSISHSEPEISDEQYVRETPETTEQIDTQAIPSTDHVDATKAFSETQEKLDTKNTQSILVIIRFDDTETRDAFKEKLRTDKLLEQYAAKMY